MKSKISVNVLKSVQVFFLAMTLMATVNADETVTSSEQVVTQDKAKKIHIELRKLKDTLEKAVNNTDIETILANVDDDVIFSTMNADVVTGRENLSNYYKNMLQGPDKVIESIQSTFVADDLSILLEDDIAIAYGHSESHYVLAIGKTLDVKGIWTSTLVYRDSKWKIASFHYSVDIFDNAILKAQSKLLWMVGAGGVFLALFAFVLGRRRK